MTRTASVKILRFFNLIPDLPVIAQQIALNCNQTLQELEHPLVHYVTTC